MPICRPPRAGSCACECAAAHACCPLAGHMSLVLFVLLPPSTWSPTTGHWAPALGLLYSAERCVRIEHLSHREIQPAWLGSARLPEQLHAHNLPGLDGVHSHAVRGPAAGQSVDALAVDHGVAARKAAEEFAADGGLETLGVAGAQLCGRCGNDLASLGVQGLCVSSAVARWAGGLSGAGWSAWGCFGIKVQQTVHSNAHAACMRTVTWSSIKAMNASRSRAL